MRVLFFSEAHGFGGGEQVLATLLDGLPRSGLVVSCICTSEAGQQALQRHVSCQDVDWWVFGTHGRPSLWRTVWPLARLIHSWRPDIVHCNALDSYAGSYAILASRLARVPVVLGTFHTAGGHPQATWLDRAFAWTVDRLLDSAILVCEGCRVPVLRDRHLRPDKLTVIYNGVPIPPLDSLPQVGHARPGSGPSERPLTVGTAGHMIPRKSFDTLIAAAALLKGRGNLQFLIFGDGPERANLLEMTSRLGLSETVHFPGWQQDMDAAFAGLDIFVLPSLNEACPMVLLEAMARALPVVATKVGGMPEIVVHNETGLLVPPRDAGALADAIQTLAVDPAARARMGRAGRDRAMAHFSAGRMVKDTHEYYLALLGRSRRAGG